MFAFLKNKYTYFLNKSIAIFMLGIFCFLAIMPPCGYAQALSLPLPGAIVKTTAEFHPPVIRALTVHPDKPFQFDFIIDTGDDRLQRQDLKVESQKLIKYFLASLTIPEDEMWVNLSPHEPDRIIPDQLGVTDLGKDLLAQDYLLKQLTASLIYPENDLGKEFWNRVRKETSKRFGVEDISTETFHKIWIVPDKAVIYKHGNSAFVVESHLKALLEEDYLADRQVDLSKTHRRQNDDYEVNINTKIIREIIVPAIEKEVNEGRNFATLRQIYHSMILAAWFKRSLRESVLGQVYIDQNKVMGIDDEDLNMKQKIYTQYLEAYKKGAYNYIKEDYDPLTQQILPRKYFSGGFRGIDSAMVEEYADFTFLSSKWQDAAITGHGEDWRITAELLQSTEANGKVDPDIAMVVQADELEEAIEERIRRNQVVAGGDFFIYLNDELLPTLGHRILWPDDVLSNPQQMAQFLMRTLDEENLFRWSGRGVQYFVVSNNQTVRIMEINQKMREVLREVEIHGRRSGVGVTVPVLSLNRGITFQDLGQHGFSRFELGVLQRIMQESMRMIQTHMIPVKASSVEVGHLRESGEILEEAITHYKVTLGLRRHGSGRVLFEEWEHWLALDPRIRSIEYSKESRPGLLKVYFLDENGDRIFRTVSRKGGKTTRSDISLEIRQSELDSRSISFMASDGLAYVGYHMIFGVFEWLNDQGFRTVSMSHVGRGGVPFFEFIVNVGHKIGLIPVETSTRLEGHSASFALQDMNFPKWRGFLRKHVEWERNVRSESREDDVVNLERAVLHLTATSQVTEVDQRTGDLPNHDDHVFRLDFSDVRRGKLQGFIGDFSANLAIQFMEYGRRNNPTLAGLIEVWSEAMLHVIYEVIANGYVHGNRADRTLPLYVHWGVENGRLIIRVFDANMQSRMSEGQLFTSWFQKKWAQRINGLGGLKLFIEVVQASRVVNYDRRSVRNQQTQDLIGTLATLTINLESIVSEEMLGEKRSLGQDGQGTSLPRQLQKRLDAAMATRAEVAARRGRIHDFLTSIGRQVSRDDIARALSLSRHTVWNDIVALREQGNSYPRFNTRDVGQRHADELAILEEVKYPVTAKELHRLMQNKHPERYGGADPLTEAVVDRDLSRKFNKHRNYLPQYVRRIGRVSTKGEYERIFSEIISGIRDMRARGVFDLVKGDFSERHLQLHNLIMTRMMIQLLQAMPETEALELVGVIDRHFAADKEVQLVLVYALFSQRENRRYFKNAEDLAFSNSTIFNQTPEFYIVLIRIYWADNNLSSVEGIFETAERYVPGDPDIKAIFNRAVESLGDKKKKRLQERDPAALSKDRNVKKIQNPGGIDLDANKLDLEVHDALMVGEENRVPFSSPQIPFALEFHDVQGFYPVIIHMERVQNLPFLLGLEGEGDRKNSDARSVDMSAKKAIIKEAEDEHYVKI